jgi:Cu(I)/Ag(I) efflux system membrane protein CusA/SilA
VGGFVKQDQVDFDPNAPVAYNLSIKDIASAIQASNNDVGGKTLEIVQFITSSFGAKNHPNPLS